MAKRGEDASRPADDRDRATFDACFEANYSLILSFARRRIEGTAAAEDIAAETFAIAWRRRDDMPDPALPWLYAIGRNVISNHRRSRARRSRLMRRMTSQPSRQVADPAEALAEHDSALAAFTQLSESQREVLRFAVWERLPPDQAAEVLGCSPVAYRVRLHRARAELEKHLDRTGHISKERPIKPSTSASAPETK